MARGPMKPADTRGDPWLEDALQAGYLDSGEVYVKDGAPGHEVANQARRAVGLAAKRRNVSVAAWVADQDGEPCYDGYNGNPPCADPDAPHQVKFKLWNRTRARTHVFHASGGDPANLKYNPWAKKPVTRYDDAGKPV